MPGPLTGDRHVAQYGPDGRLLISFRDTTHQSPSQGDWVAWVGSYQDQVEGREGQYRVRLMKNYRDRDCAYPGVEVLPEPFGTLAFPVGQHPLYGPSTPVVSSGAGRHP